MNNDEQLTPWIQAFMEAFCDFVSQSFLIGDVPESNNLQIRPSEHLIDIKNLKGASIELQANTKKITLSFLAQPPALNYIAEQVLGTDSNEAFEISDVQDTIKEMINVLAGGVKSRLSSSSEDELILGLPTDVSTPVINVDSMMVGCFKIKNWEFYPFVGIKDV